MLNLIARFGSSIWQTLREMSPFLLFGFLMAGLLSVLVKAELVERHLGGRGFWQVVKAAIFGVPLPLCSCGVIPVAASLRRHGAGSGATTSFLISTPQTGVDSIMVTLSLLGPVFAIFRPVVAFVTGLVGGVLVNAFGHDAGDPSEEQPVCTEECCRGERNGANGLFRGFRYGFVTLPRDLHKALIVGILIAGGISAVIPDGYLTAVLGGGILSMVIMMAVGIPVYVCATASVPIAAALIAKGVSPGAALVFLMTGPATNAATIATVWKIMGRRIAGIYLATVAVSALASGSILNAFFRESAGSALGRTHGVIPGSVSTVSALMLIAVLAVAFFRPARVGHTPEKAEEGGSIRLSIAGMTCSHCGETVQRALLESRGVVSAAVDLKRGEAIVSGEGLDPKRLKEAVEKLGYTVTGSDEPGDAR
jgi:uncharacterized membrane protein YraQ (UPF0718 family)/copper chaperone CopZ